ncbi:MAG: stage II sporulation protein R [Lachnospiraceae bacterium]|nr:stage II sporulation protein R [Lachnospiraceae bacterium]MBR1568482.1 stage II sporulation protein R [Lachnospiraceae bacterium]
MNLYKTALSALLIAPIIGGVSVHMIHGYQATKEKAEQITTEHTEQIEQTIKMIEEASGEVPEYRITEADNTTISYEDASIYTDPDSIYDDVQDAVIRFHVRANSDSAEDQALKMKVRNAILQELRPIMQEVRDKESARQLLQQELKSMTTIAQDVIREEGYDYPVQVYLTKEEFPLKSYGDLLFPSGSYEALRVDIGDAEGGNWWCVVYPGLCFADVAGGVVVEDGKEKLQHVLTQEEYHSLLQFPEETRETEYRSYFLELLKNL